MLTTKRALVVIVGVLLALAWAVPSIGASTAKVARKAFARANLAFYHANLAIDTSNKAKATANDASAAANSAKTAASQAQSTANQAQSTANTAQSTANQALSKARFQDNFTATLDPSGIAATACTSSPVSRAGVMASDEVIVTPPDTQPIGIVTQAFTSSGQVTVEFCNVTGGGSIDPPSGTYEFSTVR
jgi:trimeric autotransporter adhesin